ncbi:glycosyltransferase family 10 domain-containing protein [Thiomicrorhabdus arctica]|uniref:glycosyltransferase family 10 domain-containing protein n=1 Tax=Thiomicrorhabdus arctica TaxID=131540 RepID=UPI00036B259C|nr:glycosyltransferase family 10 [Thiomicrorhabdus arctica]
MKKACIVTGDSFYTDNRLFNLDDPIANRDNCLFPFYLLQKQLLENGYELSTSDLNLPSNSELVLYNEMPRVLPAPSEKQKSFLMLFESELIRPDNWIVENHKAFNTVFTWHDDLVGTNNYSKINFSFDIIKGVSKDLSKKKKLCTLIAGNKKVSHPLELYSKRIEVIRWFEKHHPENFDLYGVGWDRHRFSGPKIIRALNRVTFLTKLFAPKYPSYKGRVDVKKTTLEKYKFAICYENARDIPGYITEKIFDCLFAGCIPVYWGASNISDYIPDNCYVDMRNFNSYEELYLYLIEMNDEDYSFRLNEIELFLNSGKIQDFSAETFAQTVVNKTVIK